MPVMCGKIQKQIDNDLNEEFHVFSHLNSFYLVCHFKKWVNAIWEVVYFLIISGLRDGRGCCQD